MIGAESTTQGTPKEINMSSHMENIQKLIRDGDYERAVAMLEDIKDKVDTETELMSLLGIIATLMRNWAYAIKIFERIQYEPDASTDIPEILAVIYAMVGNLTESLFYGKLATAKPLDGRLLPFLEPGFPTFADVFTKIKEKPLLIAGESLLHEGRVADAIDLLQQHAQLFPRDEAGTEALSRALRANGQNRAAISLLRALRLVAPQQATHVSRLAEALTAVGELSEGLACHRLALSMDKTEPALHCAFLRDLAYAPDPPAKEVRAIAKDLAILLSTGTKPRGGKASETDVDHLRIGYLLGTLSRVEETRMIAEVGRHRDREHFSVVGFGRGDLSIGINLPFQMRFDGWVDTNEMDKETLAATIRGEGIDILVDACGLSSHDGMAVQPLKAAPVQIAWLGNPFGVTAPGNDVRLLDELAPTSSKNGKIDEWRLATGCYSFDYPLESIPSENPSEGNGYVSFGADATLAEMNPEVAVIWARILFAVPDSLLLIRDHDLQNEDNIRHIVALFANFGVAQRVEVLSVGDRSAFLHEVDVLLAPFPVARPYAAAQALSYGIPVVALDAPGSVCQDVAFLLRRLELDKRMLGKSHDAYIKRAISWAGDEKARIALRKDGRQALTSSTVFNPAHFTASLEEAYRGIWKKVTGQ